MTGQEGKKGGKMVKTLAPCGFHSEDWVMVICRGLERVKKTAAGKNEVKKE